MPRTPTLNKIETPRDELKEALSDINKKFKEGEEGREVQRELFEHMYEISDDPSGSDPAKYLSPEDAETCKEVAKLADSLDWPGASLLEMRSSRRGNIDAWTKPRNFAKTSLTKAIVFPVIAGRRGYVFGHTSTVPSQLVALCEGKCEGEDGEDINGVLLSKRGPELERSKGIGWGRLPDPGKIAAARAKGEAYGISYANVESLPLAKLLLKKMPAKSLAGVDLSSIIKS
jgi:hypothetical protein